ncbi:glucose dehydrogenase [Hymenobacter qilianensis]|uniref:Glucose dehydrogenase n=2 Tax=Hymenobacter qilianensis TaxID=1385715 RepID=A0ACB5PN25_9BACT|nr:PQQ-dependent sugar dehydrogenase [Hymenobacter qilianensis]QNP53643.1 PQQ-dependent sugar dehydrogenase [Hymenobacter qilianensis]GGF54293.1 glucose dehydrogenase [Hymenobacter qilianensis]
MNRRPLVVTAILLAGLTAACNQSGQEQRDQAQNTETSSIADQINRAPLETREANVPGQRPTFAGQTRAKGVKSTAAFEVTVLAKGLKNPWAVEPLPTGDLLITEKPGMLRIVSATGKVGEPIKGLPEIYVSGQGGLLDVALSPNFKTDQTIYWSFSEPRGDKGNATSVAKGVLSADRRSLSQVKVIFRALPAYDGDMHYGSRLAFGPDGMLYVSLGERSDKEIRPQAQQMNSHMGKTLRITPDGKPAPDNPFIKQAGALPEIWTVGQRNVQATAFDAQGQLWSVDMGPQGGDELNRLEGGKNYGWPLVTFGEEYSGEPVPNSVTTKQGFVDPVYYWDPVIAPSGAQFYTGAAFPAWRGNLFVGALKDRELVRLQIENGRVTGEERLLSDRKQRVRDVKQGPDGALYVVTDEADGELWKIAPQAGS